MATSTLPGSAFQNRAELGAELGAAAVFGSVGRIQKTINPRLSPGVFCGAGDRIRTDDLLHGKGRHGNKISLLLSNEFAIFRFSALDLQVDRSGHERTGVDARAASAARSA